MRLSSTPVRGAPLPESSLQQQVKDGLGALEKDNLAYIDESVRAELGDSLDLDNALHAGHDQENRWDYLLGYVPIAAVVGLEPHSAKADEIPTVISKRRAAREQLRLHLRNSARVGSWLCVASGKVRFADTEKARRRLDQHGIQFVGRKVLRRHLPVATTGANER